MSRWIWLGWVSGMLALAGCAAPPANHYYTLLPSTANGATLSPTAPTIADNLTVAPFGVSFQSIQIPEQVDRLQIVVTDPKSTQVYPLDTSLWAGSLADEIRQALGAELYKKLGVRAVAVSQLPDNFPLWKIYITVQRFESLYDAQALIDATWSLVPVNQPRRKALLCGGQAVIPVNQGMSALIAGHQAALQQLGASMAKQLQQAQSPSSFSGTAPKGCVLG